MALVVEMILRSTGSQQGNEITSCPVLSSAKPGRPRRISRPFLLEDIAPGRGRISGRGAADPARSGGHRLAVLPEAEVHDAGWAGSFGSSARSSPKARIGRSRSGRSAGSRTSPGHPGDAPRQQAILPLQHPDRCAAAAIALSGKCVLVFLVIQMRAQRGPRHPLHEPDLQLFHQPGVAGRSSGRATPCSNTSKVFCKTVIHASFR